MVKLYLCYVLSEEREMLTDERASLNCVEMFSLATPANWEPFYICFSRFQGKRAEPCLPPPRGSDSGPLEREGWGEVELGG